MEEFESNKFEYLKIPDHQKFESSIRRLKEKEREEVDFDYYLYVDQNISYKVTSERFRENGRLNAHKSLSKGYEMKKYPLLKQVGGEPNWMQEDMTPKNKDGNSLNFIGELIGFNYMMHGSNSIYLFLDESDNEVVQIFQYG